MLSLRINIARSAPEMDRIAPLWQQLLQTQPHTLFQRFSWNRLSAEMFCDHASPYVVWVESDAGAAIVPACIDGASGNLELLGDALFDYRDVLHVGEPELLRLAWEQVAATRRPLHVLALQPSAVSHRWSDFPHSAFANAPCVDRELVDEHGFRLAHSRLGRQMRRLQRLNVKLRTYSGEDSAALRRLYEAKRTNFAADTANLFCDQRRCNFMVHAAALEGRACQVFTLEKEDGTLVAGLVSFRDQMVRRCYTIYFHPEWARYSPGIALLYEVTARSLNEGLSCDYMTGEYPYKLRLANASHPLFKVEISAQELAGIAGGRMLSVA